MAEKLRYLKAAHCFVYYCWFVIYSDVEGLLTITYDFRNFLVRVRFQFEDINSQTQVVTESYTWSPALLIPRRTNLLSSRPSSASTFIKSAMLCFVSLGSR